MELELNQSQINRLYDELDFSDFEEIESASYDANSNTFRIYYTKKLGKGYECSNIYEAVIEESERLDHILNAPSMALTDKEAEALAVLLKRCKMDCWCGIDEYNNFIDLEDNEKPLEPKAALADIVDGLNEIDSYGLTPEQRKTILNLFLRYEVADIESGIDPVLFDSDLTADELALERYIQGLENSNYADYETVCDDEGCEPLTHEEIRKLIEKKQPGCFDADSVYHQLSKDNITEIDLNERYHLFVEALDYDDNLLIEVIDKEFGDMVGECLSHDFTIHSSVKAIKEYGLKSLDTLEA